MPVVSKMLAASVVGALTFASGAMATGRTLTGMLPPLLYTAVSFYRCTVYLVIRVHTCYQIKLVDTPVVHTPRAAQWLHTAYIVDG